jgi:hypothetical protein
MCMNANRTLTAVVVGTAVIYGWWAFGWEGLTLAVCLAVGWAWLQFQREKRLIKAAATRPPGKIESVVIMQAHLAHGMHMPEVVALAGCLGKKYSAQDEWQWIDASGNEIVITFRRSVVVRWAVACSEVPVDPHSEPATEAAASKDSHRAAFSALAPVAKTA